MQLIQTIYAYALTLTGPVWLIVAAGIAVGTFVMAWGIIRGGKRGER